MEKINLKSGLYRGLIAETARALGKSQPVVYSNVVYSKVPNADKEKFLALKADRDRRAEAFEKAMKKAS